MKNDWVEIKEKNGYYWAHFKKGDGVMVLGYRRTKPDKGGFLRTEVLLRLEDRPCHTAGFSSLTGIIDKGEDPISAAFRELREEAGYDLITSTWLKPVGWVYPAKFSDHKCHIFLVNLTNFETTDPTGDGSQLEENSSNHWVNLKHALNVSDPLVGKAIAHLTLEGWLE